jgi:Protein of unknown function (DUF3179)
LCHTGLVWSARLDGRTLHFHLAGINNQNFIMQDEETGSWWQQITGCALHGPLRGRCLDPIAWDEVTLAVWKEEHPETLVLAPDAKARDDYAPAGWENDINTLPVVTPAGADEPLAPRAIVVGVAAGGASKAFPITAVAEEGPINDRVGGTPVLVLLHPDRLSLRCFDRRLDGGTVQLFATRGVCPPELLDEGTGSRWDFTGTASSGSLRGKRLARLPCLRDDWFDWKTYHPDTGLYTPGAPALVP